MDLVVLNVVLALVLIATSWLLDVYVDMRRQKVRNKNDDNDSNQ